MLAVYYELELGDLKWSWTIFFFH